MVICLFTEIYRQYQLEPLRQALTKHRDKLDALIKFLCSNISRRWGGIISVGKNLLRQALIDIIQQSYP